MLTCHGTAGVFVVLTRVRRCFQGFVDAFEVLCIDAKVVARMYSRGWFLIDLLSALPYRSIADALFDDRHSSAYKFVSLLPLFRILRLKDGLSKFVEHVRRRVTLGIAPAGTWYATTGREGQLLAAGHRHGLLLARRALERVHLLRRRQRGGKVG